MSQDHMPRPGARRRRGPGPDGQAHWYYAARVAASGLEIGIATAIGWLLGRWIDGKLGTHPWVMVACLLLGATAGFVGVFRTAREANRVMQSSDDG
jgi:F0F1-type ATP synthase assembly protein I